MRTALLYLTAAAFVFLASLDFGCERGQPVAPTGHVRWGDPATCDCRLALGRHSEEDPGLEITGVDCVCGPSRTL